MGHGFNYRSRRNYRSYLQAVKSSLLSNRKYFYKLVNSTKRISVYPSRLYLFQWLRLLWRYCDILIIYTQSQTRSRFRFWSFPKMTYYKGERLLNVVVLLGLMAFHHEYSSHVFILKSCQEVRGIISNIFNVSSKIGIFFLWLKSTFHIPFHKCESRHVVDNSWNIARSCASRKFFERVVTQHLVFTIELYISPFQHGRYERLEA